MEFAMIFGKKREPENHIKHREPHTQLITGVHPKNTTWRLLRWLLFLAALLSIVCGGFLLCVRSAEAQCRYQMLKIDFEQARSIATDVAGAFRLYWVLFVLILAAVFTFFELFIHSRWKIYVIYGVIAFAAWAFVLYSLNLLELPIEELGRAGGGG